MSSCKDCVHYEVCKVLRYGDITNCDSDYCGGYFKPKSRFVELPCEVGQTVYFIDVCRTAENFGKKYISFGVVAKVSCDHKFIVVKGGSVLDWGEVFNSREEAEKALAERSK